MSNTITVEEQTHRYWKRGTILAGILCVLTFTIFWNLSSPFWESILRLVAFIFFALAVLGYLNIMNGSLTITLHFTDSLLEVSYQRQDKTIQEEEFDLATIKNINPTKSKQNLIQKLFQPESSTLAVDFSDTDRTLYLIEFGGRPLFFDPDTIEQIVQFLSDHDIRVTSV